MKKQLVILIGLLMLAPFLRAEANSELLALQQGWAQANYNTEKNKKDAAFDALIERADRAIASDPKAVSLWVWRGIIESTYAGVKGGLGALSLAKAARKDFEQSIAMEETALNGSAYTSLGTLYFKLPSWPLSFGNTKKAEELLLKGLAINPDGIDSNYFYADFLYEQGQYVQAEQRLLKAQRAAPRPDRPLADQGRQQEISALLTKVRKKID